MTVSEGEHPAESRQPAGQPPRRRWSSDAWFIGLLATITISYVLLILLMLAADGFYLLQESFENPTHPNPLLAALLDPHIQYSLKLTLISCTATAILSLWFAVPIGYILARVEFPGKSLIDAILDVPIVLPPLVVGISLLILFQYLPESMRDAVVYQIPAVVFAQFMVACAFAVRTMRATFEQLDDRREQVALTLGCTRAQAFLHVVLPETHRGMLTAATLAWARSLGEFGPILVFAGATRGKTEVLSTTVFLELSIGNLTGAVAVSLLMVVTAIVLLVIARVLGKT